MGDYAIVAKMLADKDEHVTLLTKRLEEACNLIALLEANNRRLRAALRKIAENDYPELTPEDVARAALGQNAPHPSN